MDYAEYEAEIAPAWLQGRWGRKYHFVTGILKDAWTSAAKLAIKARFGGTAPPDALPLLVRDFVLDPPFNEPESTTRSRLARAWETWQRAGTREGMIAALRAAGYADVDVKEHAEWDYTGRWWDFWIILRPPFSWDHATVVIARWGGGWRWGDGSGYIGGFPDGEPARVAALVRKWKPSHAHCVSVIVVLQGKLWGDDGFRWGEGTRFGGAAARWKA